MLYKIKKKNKLKKFDFLIHKNMINYIYKLYMF